MALTKTHLAMLESEARTKRRIKMAIAAALLLPAWKRESVEAGVFQAILVSRADAARAGVMAGRREVVSAVKAASPISIFGADAVPARYVAEAADIRSAEQAARAYLKALRAAEQVTGSLPGAVSKVAYRVDSIAATESSIAFNQAKAAEVERAANREGLDLMKTWDAELDNRTCSTCSGLAGTSVRVGEDYPGGQEPGMAHPRCRCTETISAVH